MHRRIRAPGAPPLGRGHGLTRIVRFERFQDAKITVRKRVGPSKDPHRKILNGPITDAGEFFQFGQCLIDRYRNIECYEPIRNGLSHRKNRLGTRSRNSYLSQFTDRGGCNRGRRWRQMCQAGKRRRHRSPKLICQPSGKCRRGFDADLLSKDRADCHLKSIEGSRHSQARIVRSERAKVRCYLMRSRFEVKQSSNLCQHLHQDRQERDRDFDAERRLRWIVLDKDPSLVRSDSDRSSIAVRVDLLDAGKYTPGKKPQQ